MAEVPVQFLVAAFKDEEAAQRALNALKQGRNDGVHMSEAAVLQKGQDGALHIKETSDMGPLKGAFIGALLGAGVGVLLGPIGLAAFTGAGIGAVAAELRDSGFNDARLNHFGESLTPGSSAIIAVIERPSIEQAEALIAGEAATVLKVTVAEDISNQLRKADDVLWDIETPSGSSVLGGTPTSGMQPA
jgi:uncharacterized membrane protein